MSTATPATAGTSRRNVTIVAFAAVTALALVVFMISSVTRAAWTDTTRNDGDSWATGTVSLTDDDNGVAMFTTTNMVPGTVVTNSITVTNEGTVPLNVRLYGENVDNDDDLAQHLNLSVGTTANGTEVFSGTLAGFSARTDWASGGSSISLAASATQTYHFRVELASNTPQSFQGGATAGIDFVWEGQTQ